MAGQTNQTEIQAKQGHCSLCGIEGQGSRDFLCDKCADPELLVVYCSSCGNRTYLTEQDKADSKIWEFLVKLPEFPKLESLKGLSVKLSWCPLCSGPRPEKMTILTYKIS